MGSQTERLGKELARQIHALSALKDARKEAMRDFATREQAILKEINRLGFDLRTGQTTLAMEPAS